MTNCVKRIIKKQTIKTGGKGSKYLSDDIISGSEYFEASATKPDDVDKLFRSLLSNILANEKLQERILMENQPKKIKLTNKSNLNRS